MHITVIDEPTREALIAAVWDLMSQEAEGDKLYSLMYEAGMVTFWDEPSASGREADARLDRIAALRVARLEIAAARPASRVELSIDPVTLAQRLRAVRRDVLQTDGVLSRAPEDRDRLIAIFDAAGALLEAIDVADVEEAA